MSDDSVELPALTEESVREAIRQAMADVESRERKARQAPETPTGTCCVCGGTVVGEHERATDSDPRHIPIGPGAAAHYYWKFLGYHCQSCGLKYKFALAGTTVDLPEILND